MKRKIDSKYEIVVTGINLYGDQSIPRQEPKIEIRNVFNGNVIPEDEPTFIFRAKDKLAYDTLTYYLHKCIDDGCTREQLESLTNMCNDFKKFSLDNPDKMKQPGSTMPEDIKKVRSLKEMSNLDGVDSK